MVAVQRPFLPLNLKEAQEMADFMLLFRGGEQAADGEMEARMAKWTAWMGELSAAGQLKGGAPFEEEATVLRGADKTESEGTVGGPDEEVGGYLVVSCEDRPQAVDLAKGCPIFDVNGAVEIRGIVEM